METIDGPLTANPHRVGKPLDEPFDGYHSARRGTYRIIYRINEDKLTVESTPSGTGARHTAPDLRGRRALRERPAVIRKRKHDRASGPEHKGAGHLPVALDTSPDRCVAAAWRIASPSAIQDIRAGIGKSSLYRRFHDRADLATAAIASQQRELPPRRRPADRPHRLPARRRTRPRPSRPRRRRLPARPRPADPRRVPGQGDRTVPGTAASYGTMPSSAVKSADADLDAAMKLLIGSLRPQPEPMAVRAVDAVLTGLRSPGKQT